VCSSAIFSEIISLFNEHFLSRFSEDTLNVEKLLRRSVENPWVRYSLKKNGGKTKWKGDKVFIEPLGGVERTP
jgi:hypothetical protein